MAKILVLVLGIVLALVLTRVLGSWRAGVTEKQQSGSAKLVRCPSCGSYHPEGDPCGCDNGDEK